MRLPGRAPLGAFVVMGATTTLLCRGGATTTYSPPPAAFSDLPRQPHRRHSHDHADLQSLVTGKSPGIIEDGAEDGVPGPDVRRPGPVTARASYRDWDYACGQVPAAQVSPAACSRFP